MTTVSEITPVVNLDTGYSCRHDGWVTPIEALLSRIDEELRSGGRFRSEREWCRKAGISESYIAALRLRGGKGGTGEVVDVKREQVVRLAKAAGLDPAKLLGDELRTTPTAPAPQPSTLEGAIADFEWPSSLTAQQAHEVLVRARAEASEHPSLPKRFWLSRLAKLATDVHEARSRVRKTTGAAK